MADEPKGRDTDWHTGRRGPPDESTPRDLAPADCDCDEIAFDRDLALEQLAAARTELASLRQENARWLERFEQMQEERASFGHQLSASTAERAALEQVRGLPAKWEQEASETDGGHRGEAKRFALQNCAEQLRAALAPATPNLATAGEGETGKEEKE